MRAKRIALFSVLIVVFAAIIYLLPKLLGRHRFVDTSGEIVYASDKGSPGQTHLFIAKPDGTLTRQLTRGNFSDTQPSFSPDGTQIAFVSDRGGSPQVYVMSADGANARAISIGSDQKLSPQFSADGQSVGYISRGQLLVTDVIGGHTDLVLPTSQNVSSTSTQSLSNAARSPVIAFAWSPSLAGDDRYKIAAVQQSPDNDLQTVALVDLSNSATPPVVLAGASLASIAWSPDGKQLAAALIGASGPDGQPQNVSGIIDFKPDGTQLYPEPIAPVASSSAGAQDPTFSPKGGKLLFGITQMSKLGTPLPGGIAVTNAQPSSAVQVVIRGGAHNPELSRDGKYFLFLGPSAPTSAVNQGLYAVTPTTGQIKPITTRGENVTSAQWSPAAPRGT